MSKSKEWWIYYLGFQIVSCLIFLGAYSIYPDIKALLAMTLVAWAYRTSGLRKDD